MKTEVVPILSLSEKEKIFVENSIKWKPRFHSLHEHFHINKLEDFIDHLKFPFTPHRQTVFDFVFLVKGKSTRSKGLDTYEFGSNTFFFLPAFQISTHERLSPDSKGYYCHFDREIFNRSFIKSEAFDEFPFLNFTGNPLVTIETKSLPHINSILSKLEIEYSSNNASDIDSISVNLLSLFMEVRKYSTYKKTKENASYKIANLFKNKLSNSIYEKHSIAEYANMLSVSPNHLNKCIKAATGKSAQELLNEMVILEAKVLLKQSSLTINEIAWKIGREELSDFIRFFKSKTGSTPTEYRKMD